MVSFSVANKPATVLSKDISNFFSYSAIRGYPLRSLSLEDDVVYGGLLPIKGNQFRNGASEFLNKRIRRIRLQYKTGNVFAGRNPYVGFIIPEQVNLIAHDPCTFFRDIVSHRIAQGISDFNRLLQSRIIKFL